ncbi:hypothetical protein IHN63_00125 [Deinococcus sp. 6YEL10]|uniref:hypothetical protein n=1 Tax=Deinococcus sp. 6YEL10 TaxID=2745870 RepID=UPI001E3C1543|nr:hypothetical protein [Deinococcus sp. 6YEL10]MCD0159704.1 hypothetical protein [Deinococcus sp. 6YEL10]
MTSVLTHLQSGLPPDYQEFLIDLTSRFPGLRDPDRWHVNDLRNAYEWCKHPYSTYGHGPDRRTFHDHPFVPWVGHREELVTYALILGPARNARNFKALTTLYVHQWRRLPVLKHYHPAVPPLLNGQDVPASLSLHDLFHRRPQ